MPSFRPPQSNVSHSLRTLIRPSSNTQTPRYLSRSAILAAQSDTKPNASEAPGVPHGGSSLVRQEDSSDALPSHRPDYGAPIDHGTSSVNSYLLNMSRLTYHSSFSPVPKRVMDGSEPGDVTAAAVLSGAPTDLQARTVRFVLTVGLSLGFVDTN